MEDWKNLEQKLRQEKRKLVKIPCQAWVCAHIKLTSGVPITLQIIVKKLCRPPLQYPILSSSQRSQTFVLFSPLNLTFVMDYFIKPQFKLWVRFITVHDRKDTWLRCIKNRLQHHAFLREASNLILRKSGRESTQTERMEACVEGKQNGCKRRNESMSCVIHANVSGSWFSTQRIRFFPFWDSKRGKGTQTSRIPTNCTIN